MMKKSEIVSLATIVLVFSAMGIGYLIYENETQVQKNFEETVMITLTIDYGGVKPNETHSSTFTKGTTVFEITATFSELKIKNYSSLGILVEGINGVISNANLTNYYWFYYVNGELGDRASNLFSLEKNSNVLWKYEAFSG